MARTAPNTLQGFLPSSEFQGYRKTPGVCLRTGPPSRKQRGVVGDHQQPVVGPGRSRCGWGGGIKVLPLGIAWESRC